MRKSPTPLNVVIRLVIVAAAANCMLPDLSGARRRPVIEVTIESEHHVGPFSPLKLTFRIPRSGLEQPVEVHIPNAVGGGAGLVVEHVARDGTVTTQSLPSVPRWFSHYRHEMLRIESSTVPIYFNFRVTPLMNLDFSELGIYHISYVHPLPGTEEDPNSPVFVSNTLTIACVSQQRYDQLQMIVRGDSELALASYMFKNPSAAVEDPQYRRGEYLGPIDEAIRPGARRDEVLFLLGSPDTVGYTPLSEQETSNCDEKWLYGTSPVGGYYVNFKEGRVVSKGRHADWAG
jgi:hypothetical protein